MTMRLLYVANARIPTEKAHGIAIMKACQAFVRADVKVTLVVAKRKNVLPPDAHAFYEIPDPFSIVRLPTLDLFGIAGGRAIFFTQAFTFYTSLFFWTLFQPRSQIIYTRDAPVCLLSLLGFEVFLECHAAPEKGSYYWLAHLTRGVIVT